MLTWAIAWADYKKGGFTGQAYGVAMILDTVIVFFISAAIGGVSHGICK